MFYFQFPLQSMLQAMNLARAAMINSLIGAIVKIAIIFMLATKENFGIMGAAIGIAVGTVLVTFLHFSTVIKVVPISLHIRHYLSSLLIAIVSGFGGFYAYHFSFTNHVVSVRLLSSLSVLIVIYPCTHARNWRHYQKRSQTNSTYWPFLSTLCLASLVILINVKFTVHIGA